MRQINPHLDVISHLQWVPQNGRPLIIAGPCSAESEEQVMQTAQAVSKIPGVNVFRAGVWKPRTRPNGFEGVGVTALKWLKNVREETGLQTAVEVARAQHVYEALKYGVDILWIGARTSVNPFSVQEIADALQGADVPVWVKNPINPDLNLWIGALERLNQAGIKRLGAIHRGFSTYEKSPYRNAPKWEIPIELKRLAPDIPIICDPSHISGRREIIPSLSQKALDMAMNGLMIETHIDPDKALSDAAQQILPQTLKEILDHLQYRKPQGDGVDPQEFLANLRHEIDLADSALLEAIARRDEIVCKIGLYKKNHNMTILQVTRWQQLLEDRLEQAAKLGLDDTFIKSIYQLLHDRSIQIQSTLMNQRA